ncbi:hypothetical protein CAPTEDRAFT_209387 [Capitella teleta]|uniref:EF-hand domain-containing protein n=1 Tax=Capitella teleta TaxID=283909 RepID=R7V5P0_CAPTE|nr:hypothetical protein CAPTEDRAFT_209387 [Capitella teleta]|eukprot:ELU11100.1 hypothetical protein CAPTEDRAFT_209387 [Capitella teleta]
METKTFTEDQLKKYRRAFDVYDLNHNGCIEATELKALAQYMGYRISQQQIYAIIKKLNLDEKGVITFDDFLRAMPGNTEVITEDEHRRSAYKRKFLEYDPQNKGFVAASAAKKILKDELRCSDGQFESLVSHFQLDVHENLNYEEFVEFYCKLQESKKRIQQSFREFDMDDKGFVSMEDAQRTMASYGFSDNEIVSLFNLHDRNQDNLLNYEEFISFWGVCVE